MRKIPASISPRMQGRKNKDKFSGAQGAGTVDSKDVAKLDVFARVQGKKEEALRAGDAPLGARKKAVYRKKRH